jgi:hypothetical protein
MHAVLDGIGSVKNFISGKEVRQTGYRCFQPGLINRAWKIDDMELIQLLGQADRELGRLDMYSEYIPDIDLFIQMHVLTRKPRMPGISSGRAKAGGS